MIASEEFEIEYQPETRKLATPASSDYPLPQLIAALFQRKCDDYTDWVRDVIALRNTDENLKWLADKWSQTSPKYNATEFEKVWNSISSRSEDQQRTWRSILYKSDEQPEYRFNDGVDFLQMAFPQVDLIKGCLVENQSCIAGGGLKTLKTTFSMEAGLSVATGTDFLFTFPCKRGPVAFMSGESGNATLQETMHRILRAKRATLERGFFQITSDLPLFTQPLEKLETMLKDWGIILLGIDPLYLCMDGDGANNLFKMGPQLRNVGQMCCENGITPILNHHVTKSAGASNKQITPNDLQWSGAGEFARQWWLLNRVSDYEQGTGIHNLYLSIGSSSGLSKGLYINVNEGVRPENDGDPPRKWEVEILETCEVKASKKEASLEKQLEQVRIALTQCGHLPASSLAEQAGINFTKFKDLVLPAALEQKIVRKVAGKKTNHPHYELCNEPNA